MNRYATNHTWYVEFYLQKNVSLLCKTPPRYDNQGISLFTLKEL